MSSYRLFLITSRDKPLSLEQHPVKTLSSMNCFNGAKSLAIADEVKTLHR